MADIAKEMQRMYGSDVEVRYVDILADPGAVPYKDMVAEAFTGMVDMPVVYIDGVRKIAGILSAEILERELTTMGVKSK